MGIRISFYIIGVAIVSAFAWCAYSEMGKGRSEGELPQMAELSNKLNEITETVNSAQLSGSPGAKT